MGAPNFHFNPVFTKFNTAYKLHQSVCSTSREKRTSKLGSSMIISSQCGVMGKGCLSVSFGEQLS